MEAIDSTPKHLELYLDGIEFFVLLRPTGLLAGAVEAHADACRGLQVKKFETGAVLLVTPSAIVPIVNGQPTHACDDRLRFLVAKWNREHISPPFPLPETLFSTGNASVANPASTPPPGGSPASMPASGT